MANSVVYVSDGDYGNLTKGNIVTIVQGQYGQAILIEVRDQGNSLVNLTGHTITGRKRDANGNVVEIAGTLALTGTPAAAPQVSFTPDEDDSGDDGYFTVILNFSNGSSVLKTFPARWVIVDDPAVNATQAAGLVGVPESRSALLNTIYGLTGLVKMAGNAATGIVIQSFMETFLASATAIAARINLLPSYTGNAAKVLAVNATADDVEWVAQSGGGGVVAWGDITGDPADQEDLALILDGKQNLSTKLTAIHALTWAANSVIWLTGTTTAIVQTFAAHVVTFLQSASAADARSAIGAASTGANTFTGEQTFADQLLTRPVIKDYGEAVNAIGSTGGGTQDIDLTLGNVVSATVDTSTNTFTFSNPSASGTSCSFTLYLTNGGSQTVNWPASVHWAGGTAPTLTSSGVDILTFATIDGGTIWYGFAAGLDMS